MPPPMGSQRITSAPSCARVMPPSGAATNAALSMIRSPARMPGTSGLRRQQRHAEQGTALQPRTGAITGVAVERVHTLEDGQDMARPELIAHSQRAHGVAQAQAHTEID